MLAGKSRKESLSTEVPPQKNVLWTIKCGSSYSSLSEAFHEVVYINEPSGNFSPRRSSLQGEADWPTERTQREEVNTLSVRSRGPPKAFSPDSCPLFDGGLSPLLSDYSVSLTKEEDGLKE